MASRTVSKASAPEFEASDAERCSEHVLRLGRQALEVSQHHPVALDHSTFLRPGRGPVLRCGAVRVHMRVVASKTNSEQRANKYLLAGWNVFAVLIGRSSTAQSEIL